jgi:hypothetical protein
MWDMDIPFFNTLQRAAKRNYKSLAQMAQHAVPLFHIDCCACFVFFSDFGYVM